MPQNVRPIKIGPPAIVDEVCTCGHKRSMHWSRHGVDGHGQCRECFCGQYRWKRFIFERRPRAKAKEARS